MGSVVCVSVRCSEGFHGRSHKTVCLCWRTCQCHRWPRNTMVWIKIAAVSAIGVYGYRSISRVNQLVNQVKVPRHSLLDKYNSKTTNGYKEYKDAFKIELPPRFKLLKNTGSSNELLVSDMARHFFTCKIFHNLERPIIIAAMKLKDMDRIIGDDILKFRAFKFQKNDTVLVWKVIRREHNEILMKWEFGQLTGTTWFCVPRDDNVLLFGSSMLLPKDNPGKEEIYKKEPKELYVEAARTLPEKGVSLLSQARSVVVNASVSLLLPIHKMYSKYLLLSTYNKILTEDKLDKRKPEIPF